MDKNLNINHILHGLEQFASGNRSKAIAIYPVYQEISAMAGMVGMLTEKMYGASTSDKVGHFSHRSIWPGSPCIRIAGGSQPVGNGICHSCFMIKQVHVNPSQ